MRERQTCVYCTLLLWCMQMNECSTACVCVTLKFQLLIFVFLFLKGSPLLYSFCSVAGESDCSGYDCQPSFLVFLKVINKYIYEEKTRKKKIKRRQAVSFSLKLVLFSASASIPVWHIWWTVSDACVCVCGYSCTPPPPSTPLKHGGLIVSNILNWGPKCSRFSQTH